MKLGDAFKLWKLRRWFVCSSSPYFVPQLHRKWPGATRFYFARFTIYNLQFTKLPEHLHFASLSNHSISRSFVTNKRLLPNWLSCFIILFTSLSLRVIWFDIFTSLPLKYCGTSIALQNGAISQCVSEIENHIKYFPTPPLSPGRHWVEMSRLPPRFSGVIFVLEQTHLILQLDWDTFLNVSIAC